MREIELVLLLLVLVTALTLVARRFTFPYPIVMVLGGLLLSQIPALPAFELPPELVFFVFLPPLLFAGGYFTSLRDFKANLRPIFLLAFGLVIFTAGAVAVVAHMFVPTLGWAGAFALGAIVSPPDAVAATAIFQRMGVPRRIVTILEGESLVNDATALVIYRFAVAAAAAGTFSLIDAGGSFFVVLLGGLAVGVVVGRAGAWILARIRDTGIAVMVTLLAPFAAYLSAESIGVSGVLATVVGGLFARSWLRQSSSDTRIVGFSAWQMVLFLLNGLVFMLIGLQLPSVIRGVSADPAEVATLAAALALPVGFPERNLILFLVFAIILVTLVGQGLTLPLVIKKLGVVSTEDGSHDEVHARGLTTEAALARIEELRTKWPGHIELIDQLRDRYAHRARHDEMHHEDGGAAEQELLEHGLIKREVIDAERQAAINLHDRGVITDEVLRRIERDLDLEDLRMEA